MGVTSQDWAISAMVNWRALYMRWALLMRAGVILGLRPPTRPASPSGEQAGLGAFFDNEGGFVLGHEGEHAEDELSWVVVVSTMPLVSDRTPTPRVCRVVTMSMRSRRLRPRRSIFQMIKVSPRRRSPRHAFHCGRSVPVPVPVAVSV